MDLLRPWLRRTQPGGFVCGFPRQAVASYRLRRVVDSGCCQEHLRVVIDIVSRTRKHSALIRGPAAGTSRSPGPGPATPCSCCPVADSDCSRRTHLPTCRLPFAPTPDRCGYTVFLPGSFVPEARPVHWK